jgi:radical SAM/Cys-rich protein
MGRSTFEACLRALQNSDIATVDLTGGAPEMNPHFRWFVGEVRALGRKVIVRCNLTIVTAGAAYADLPDFFARNQVNVVSSLPHYSQSWTDRQRGDHVFEKSIEALKRLNLVGYGAEGLGLVLDLVHNPVGAFLPGAQAQLEADYKRELLSRFGIRFNRLFTITNMPISRFLEALLKAGKLEEYLERLVDAFNPAAAAGVMCRNTLSVGWDGRLYDCDFNQMLELPVLPAPARTIESFDPTQLNHRPIALGQHCYGCTAGSGSSCGGATV